MGSQSKRLKGVRKMGDDGKWVPGKISELIHDFARPLLDAMGEPRSIDDLRNVFKLARICWNLPVFERTGDPQHQALRQQFDSSLNILPPSVAALLDQLTRAPGARRWQ